MNIKTNIAVLKDYNIILRTIHYLDDWYLINLALENEDKETFITLCHYSVEGKEKAAANHLKIGVAAKRLFDLELDIPEETKYDSSTS